MTWIGRKRLAFVPLYRPHAIPPDGIPPDWSNDILRRVFYDPSLITKYDRSLRSYVHTVSSGVADLDAAVLPMEVVDEQDVPPDALESQLGSQLRSDGFDAAAIVMLGGVGSGTNRGYWSRFVMAENVGVWAMEFMHSLTGFADLYTFHGNFGSFDEMACSCAVHPSAYTKAAIGWIDPSTIAHHSNAVADYQLHSVGLVQPPPAGRVAAVQIGEGVPYLMVEARQIVDQYDSGIPSEGVIVYQVQTTDPLGRAQNETPPIDLKTAVALKPGERFTAASGTVVQVTGGIPGGYSVQVSSPRTTVPAVVGLNVNLATHAVQQARLKPNYSGTFTQHSWVSSQSPDPGDSVPEQSAVTMHLSNIIPP